MTAPFTQAEKAKKQQHALGEQQGHFETAPFVASTLGGFTTKAEAMMTSIAHAHANFLHDSDSFPDHASRIKYLTTRAVLHGAAAGVRSYNAMARAALKKRGCSLT